MAMTGSVRAAVMTRPGTIELERFPVPTLSPAR